MRAAVIAMIGATTGCLPPLTTPAENVIDLHYRLHAAAPSTTAAVRVYHWAGARSIASRCRMAPSDSEAFAIRAQRCGGIAAWYWGMSRLLLERAGSPRFARPLRIDGQLHWVDVPGPCR